MSQRLKHITAFFISALMLMKMLSMPLVYLDYILHQEEITALLCENKAQTEMQCNGKCHLKKQLDKANDSTESNTERSTAKILSVEFFEEYVNPLDVHFETSILKFTYFTLTPDISNGVLAEIFEPPGSITA